MIAGVRLQIPTEWPLDAEHQTTRRARFRWAAGRAILVVLLSSISRVVSAANGSQVSPLGPILPGGPASGFGLTIETREPADLWIKKVDRLIDAGELKEARARLKQETAMHGINYETLFREARILFRERKYRESLKVLARCMELNQQDPELYKLVASDAILANRMDIAETALKTALRLAPTDCLVPFHLGAFYYTDSRFEQA